MLCSWNLSSIWPVYWTTITLFYYRDKLSRAAPDHTATDWHWRWRDESGDTYMRSLIYTDGCDAAQNALHARTPSDFYFRLFSFIGPWNVPRASCWMLWARDLICPDKISCICYRRVARMYVKLNLWWQHRFSLAPFLPNSHTRISVRFFVFRGILFPTNSRRQRPNKCLF